MPFTFSIVQYFNCCTYEVLLTKDYLETQTIFIIQFCNPFGHFLDYSLLEMTIGLDVGVAFLSSALNVIFDRLAPHGDWLKIFKTRKHDLPLLTKLRRTLLGIQAVLNDAENKQSSNRYVSEWLGELQDVVEDAENLLEEINYEALKLKVEPQNQQEEVSGQFFENIMPRVKEAIETLEDLENQIGHLGLLRNFGSSSKQETPKRQPTTSVVDDSDVYGRKNEKEQLVTRLLLSDDTDGEKPTVIPIIGMGGLGKTTLAKLVYNDPRLKGCFDLKAWVCVSEPYDVFKITKGLLQEINGPSDSLANDTPNQIESKLKERIKGKKFLFVLDDIWNDSYVDWVDLKSLFVQGKIGSKVIVTTRKDSVVKTMGTVEPVHLKTLSCEESWSLFERHAFKNKELREHPEYQEVGKRIANKCKGLPLALKTIAGLLRQKLDIEEWKSVLRSGMWEQSINSDILPALQLSYNDLPQHLKCCFAYLAIFPKDFALDREYIVQLWTANDLVQQLQADETTEDIGNRYFLELVSRTLIEKQSEKFMMHDLVNDLALSVCSKSCLRLEDLQGSDQCITHLLQSARHVSHSVDKRDTFKKLGVHCEMKRLRTLLSVNPLNSYSYFNKLSKRVLQNILPKMASLRVLSLSYYRNGELPDDFFMELKQLRFLDLSYTYLTKLPTSTYALYNLQTLLLSHCWHLHALPQNIESLINLQYLDVRDTLLKIELPASKLMFINVLLGANFELSEGDDGTWIEDLGNLHNLRGQLSISKLQNVGNGTEAEKAKLREKEHIEKLSLQWSPTDADDSQIERDILDMLHPSTKIREIIIYGYRGTKFPNWLGYQSYCNLMKLSLENCNNCDSLPSLGQLPSLKSLSIITMRGISRVSEEFYGNDQSSVVPFHSLVELEFVDMPEWKDWLVLGDREFPKLENLSIRSCPNLIVKLPEKLYSLRVLRIDNVSDCCNLSRFLAQNELKELILSNLRNSEGGLAAPNLKKLSLSLSSLETLDLDSCPEIELSPEGGFPFSLENLSITRCEKLVNSCRKNWRLDELPSLRYLQIWHDGSDEGIVSGEGWELPSTIQQLSLKNLRTLNSKTLESITSLQSLEIEKIPNIQSLLEEGSLLYLTSLRHLTIQSCNQLQFLPEKGLPSSLSSLSIDDCPQLRSLPEKGVPSSLSTLRISDCHQLQSLPEKGLPTSLSDLSIGDCPQLQSLPEGLPTSLSHLYIEDCPQIQSLPEEGLPTSLSNLLIHDCPQLQSLPENGLPSSISQLRISKCPLLESRIASKKGVDWPKVAHIPLLYVNDEHML